MEKVEPVLIRAVMTSAFGVIGVWIVVDSGELGGFWWKRWKSV